MVRSKSSGDARCRSGCPTYDSIKYVYQARRIKHMLVAWEFGHRRGLNDASISGLLAPHFTRSTTVPALTEAKACHSSEQRAA